MKFKTTKPTQAILRIVELVETGIMDYHKIANNISIGKYESVVESSLLINIAAKNLISILHLSKIDLGLIQSALILSRNVFESSIQAAWLLHPSDIFQSESRWLGRIEAYENYLKKVIKLYIELDINHNHLDAEVPLVNGFRTEIEKQLNQKGYNSVKTPNIKDILISFNEHRKYLYYMLLSQYTHSSYHALNLYRRNLGTEQVIGEFFDLNDWRLVFAVSWPSFQLATDFYITTVTEHGMTSAYSDEFKNEISNKIMSLNIFNDIVNESQN